MYLCCVGWFELSAKVCFPFMDDFMLFGVLWMEMPKYEFMMLSVSISAVNFKFVCKMFKSIKMTWISVWLESIIRRMSSTYMM